MVGGYRSYDVGLVVDGMCCTWCPVPLFVGQYSGSL